MGFVKPLVVFAYDFDGTLAPGYMQDHAFIPTELEMERDDFWAATKSLAREQRGDEIHAYMHLMLLKAKEREIDLSLRRWRERGAQLSLFPGVTEWFARQNARAAEFELDLRHFIISSGNREMLEGSPIAHEFERVYASAFIFDEEEKASGVALGVNYTNKTQYLFRINKWTLDEWDDTAINQFKRMQDRPVPFDRIAYFGDGATDVPTMRLVTDQGGYAVAVYNPDDARSKLAANDLRTDGRAKFAGPADYREGSPLDNLAAAMLVEIANRVHAQNLVAWPE